MVQRRAHAFDQSRARDVSEFVTCAADIERAATRDTEQNTTGSPATAQPQVAPTTTFSFSSFLNDKHRIVAVVLLLHVNAQEGLMDRYRAFVKRVHAFRIPLGRNGQIFMGW